MVRPQASGLGRRAPRTTTTFPTWLPSAALEAHPAVPLRSCAPMLLCILNKSASDTSLQASLRRCAGRRDAVLEVPKVYTCSVLCLFCAHLISIFCLLLTPNTYCLEFFLSSAGGYFCNSTLASECASVDASITGIDVGCWNALYEFFSKGKCILVSMKHTSKSSTHHMHLTWCLQGGSNHQDKILRAKVSSRRQRRSTKPYQRRASRLLACLAPAAEPQSASHVTLISANHPTAAAAQARRKAARISFHVVQTAARNLLLPLLRPLLRP